MCYILISFSIVTIFLISCFELFFVNIVKVHKKLASSASKGDMYETELLEQFADTEAAKEFFACLDHQLNKVNQFYKAKENEFLERGESLKKQMEILIELKATLKQQRAQSSSQELKEDVSISHTILCGMTLNQFFSFSSSFVLFTANLRQGDLEMECSYVY